MLRNVLSGLSAAALVFAFTANANAQNLCDYDCEGSTLCEVVIDGVTVVMGGVNFMDGSDPKDVSDTEKVVTIKCKELNVQDREKKNKGTATNDEDQESTITLTSNSADGVPFYPASAVVKSFVRLEMNGKKYTTKDPLVLKSVDKISSWPSEDAVEYELAKDVTFTTNDATDSRITFTAGSTATMKAAQ